VRSIEFIVHHFCLLYFAVVYKQVGPDKKEPDPKLTALADGFFHFLKNTELKTLQFTIQRKGGIFW
jgi:hypothetical protein